MVGSHSGDLDKDSDVGDEILHVNDIQDFEELPMFKYTLRVLPSLKVNTKMHHPKERGCTYLNGVNLELGKLANATEIRKLQRRRSAEHIDQSEMGDVGRKMYVAVHSANYTNKIMKDPDEHFNVKDHGDKVREIMANMERGDDLYSTQNLFDGNDDEDKGRARSKTRPVVRFHRTNRTLVATS